MIKKVIIMMEFSRKNNNKENDLTYIFELIRVDEMGSIRKMRVDETGADEVETR